MRMKSAIIVVGILALAFRMEAQTAEAAKEPAKASLEGSVVKEPGGEPLKKAIIELITENQEEGSNYTATSDQDGHFKIMGIVAGRYQIFVERTGYIEVDEKRRRLQGIALSFEAGQELKEQTLHMLPAAIILGRVRDEDGDPMSNVDVAVLRRKGSSAFEPVGTAQTNDLGEYRVGGLLAGKYYVLASPMANFQSLVASPKTEDPAAPNSDTAYVATFYPGTSDRAQATSIDLHPGEETPVDFSLSRRRTARIRGTVAGLPAGGKAAVMLRGKDTQSMFNAAEVDKNGKFEIPHVAPGTYIISAMSLLADPPLIVRQNLEVSDANVDDVRLVPQPVATLRGHVHLEGKLPKPGTPGLMVILRPVDEDSDTGSGIVFNDNESAGSSNLGKIKPDGSFELKNVLPGVYDILVGSDSQQTNDAFTESLMVGTKDFVDSGLTVSGGTTSVDLTVSSGAGVVDGVVTNDKGTPVVNAIVVAVPEVKFRKQPNRYQRSSTDQVGHFVLHGLRPGNYTLFAWEVIEDEYLDPDFLKPVESHGAETKVEKSSHQTVPLKVIAAPADQP
jgi:Carboxypeptidase regulatory-like domain